MASPSGLNMSRPFRAIAKGAHYGRTGALVFNLKRMTRGDSRSTTT